MGRNSKAQGAALGMGPFAFAFALFVEGTTGREYPPLHPGLLSIVVDDRVLGSGLILGLLPDSVGKLDPSNHLRQQR